MGMFSTIHTAYSGLSAQSLATEVTGHNIANANTEGYTRQRAMINSTTPFETTPGEVGTGAQVVQITRVYDAFGYENYRKASTNLSFSDFQKSTLEELSTYFPDIDNEGIMKDLSAYFDAWQAFASTPTSGSAKVALAQSTQALSEGLQKTREQVSNLQVSIDRQLQSMVDEVNQLTKKIADINKKVTTIEANGIDHANDLRDERDKLEMTLSQLIGPTVNKNKVISNTQAQSSEVNYNDYVALVSGFNIIDGGSSHDIVMTQDHAATGFSALYFESQDGRLYDMSFGVTGGKIGAILDLRGKVIDSATGVPEDGKLQKYLDQLDAMAKTLIQESTNIYAQSGTTKMSSNEIGFDQNMIFSHTDIGVKDGSFDVALYDGNGKEVGRRTIDVNSQLDSIGDILDRMNAKKDDNADNNSLNDLDDFFKASYNYDTTLGKGTINFQINDDKVAAGMKFAIIDNGTNFTGAFGLGRFFDGSSARDIGLTTDLRTNPTKINAYNNPVEGNNVVANAMQQLQFNQFTITTRTGVSSKETISSYYRTMVSSVASDAATAIQTNATFSAIKTTSQQIFESTTKVNLDEELTNLMKFQTGYTANSKVITTIDQMLNTLLGIKQ